MAKEPIYLIRVEYRGLFRQNDCLPGMERGILPGFTIELRALLFLLVIDGSSFDLVSTCVELVDTSPFDPVPICVESASVQS
jgi:hypothetical protein